MHTRVGAVSDLYPLLTFSNLKSCAVRCLVIVKLWIVAGGAGPTCQQWWGVSVLGGARSYMSGVSVCRPYVSAMMRCVCARRCWEWYGAGPVGWVWEWFWREYSQPCGQRQHSTQCRHSGHCWIRRRSAYVCTCLAHVSAVWNKLLSSELVLQRGLWLFGHIARPVQFSQISSIVLRGKVSEGPAWKDEPWALLETDCNWWIGSEGEAAVSSRQLELRWRSSAFQA